MKSYTDIEQSKKLAEILPIESADMWWNFYSVTTDNTTPQIIHLDTPWVGNFNWDNKSNNIPCWSLASLLSVLPQSITKYIKSESCQKTFHLNLFRSYYYCCSYSFNPSVSDDDGNNTLYCIGKDSWIDACYEMIIKLNELNLM